MISPYTKFTVRCDQCHCQLGTCYDSYSEATKAVEQAGWTRGEYTIMEPNGMYWLCGELCPGCARHLTLADWTPLKKRE